MLSVKAMDCTSHGRKVNESKLPRSIVANDDGADPTKKRLNKHKSSRKGKKKDVGKGEEPKEGMVNVGRDVGVFK